MHRHHLSISLTGVLLGKYFDIMYTESYRDIPHRVVYNRENLKIIWMLVGEELNECGVLLQNNMEQLKE